MGLFTNYKKLSEGIQYNWNRDYEQYKKNMSDYKTKAQHYCDRYRDEIGVINADRHQMRDEINSLYDFLESFGNIGDKITPFDYITETSKSVTDNYNNGDFPNENIVKDPSKAYDTIGITSALTAVLIPTISTIAAPVVLIAGIAKRKKNKELYEDLLIQYESAKISYEKSCEDARQEIQMFKDATEIAIVYRNIIATVRDAIKKTIIPELSAIRSFLYADAIANKIAYDEDITVSIIPTDIMELQDTKYNEHYIFVKNTFDYYKIITNFFTKQVLTKLIEDKNITYEERQQFNNNVNKIKSHSQQIEQNAIFNKG